jgi:hypothetical protein
VLAGETAGATCTIIHQKGCCDPVVVFFLFFDVSRIALLTCLVDNIHLLSGFEKWIGYLLDFEN